jgi:hypothetical protein
VWASNLPCCFLARQRYDCSDVVSVALGDLPLGQEGLKRPYHLSLYPRQGNSIRKAHSYLCVFHRKRIWRFRSVLLGVLRSLRNEVDAFSVALRRLLFDTSIGRYANFSHLNRCRLDHLDPLHSDQLVLSRARSPNTYRFHDAF